MASMDALCLRATLPSDLDVARWRGVASGVIKSTTRGMARQ